MYCVKCGAKIDDDSKFCTVCGVRQEMKDTIGTGGVICSDLNNDQIESSNNGNLAIQKATPKKRNKLPMFLLAALLCAGGIYYWSTGAFSKEPCDWCGSTPTRAYKIDTDDISYVCKTCSNKCLYCGKRATKHAPNLFHMMIFMCDDCYRQMASYQ